MSVSGNGSLLDSSSFLGLGGLWKAPTGKLTKVEKLIFV